MTPDLLAYASTLIAHALDNGASIGLSLDGQVLRVELSRGNRHALRITTLWMIERMRAPDVCAEVDAQQMLTDLARAGVPA